MSHIAPQALHANHRRGLDLQIDVETTAAPGDLSATTFRVTGHVTKTVSPQAGGAGITIDLTLTAGDLDFTPGAYAWECFATIGGQVRTLAYGPFFLDPEPTSGETP